VTATVGVVVPAYNGERFLRASLGSLAGQERLPDQVVVVDDGSSDDTADEARRWASRLPLEVISHDTNRGLCQSRRTGIGHLGTDAVATLDADDVWLPDHLATMMEIFNAHGGLVTADALRWSPTAAISLRSWNRDRPVPPPEEQLFRLLLANFVFVSSVFSLDAYKRVGGFRPFPGCEDWDLWIRLVSAGAVVRRPAHPTALYRLHAGSMSSDHSLVASELRVLEAFREEQPDRAAAAGINHALRVRRAALNLREAYNFSRRGRHGRARLAAIAALRGSRPVRARAALMTLAPRRTTATRDRLVRTAGWSVRH
jgi:glycosyltransferase involved in cell wall biosynthesis